MNTTLGLKSVNRTFVHGFVSPDQQWSINPGYEKHA